MAMTPSEEAQIKNCCADLYQSEIARLILGETLHPGGLRLTHRLGRLMGIQPGDWVVDLASGRGASAMALARAFKCRVLGLEYGAEAVADARRGAGEAAVPAEAHFARADAESPPLKDSIANGAICECSMSIFTHKSKTLREVARVLRPGGKVGLSDVTLEHNCLPPELDSQVGRILCLTDALNPDGYTGLMEQAGLVLSLREDASGEVVNLLNELETKLEAFSAWQGVGEKSGADDGGWQDQARSALLLIREVVARRELGYWLFVAEKPR